MTLALVRFEIWLSKAHPDVVLFAWQRRLVEQLLEGEIAEAPPPRSLGKIFTEGLVKEYISATGHDSTSRD